MLGEIGPFCKSTVKVGLKNVLDTRTHNCDLWNHAALECSKYQPPTKFVRSN